MSDTPTPGAIPQPDLSQQQNPKAQPQPVSPDQVRQGQSGGGNLQRILSYFESQGASPEQVVATIAGMPLKLSDLKGAGSSAPRREPGIQPQSDEPVHEDEFKP